MKQRILWGFFVTVGVLLIVFLGYLVSGQYASLGSYDEVFEPAPYGHVHIKESSVGVIVYGGGKVAPLSYGYLSALEANVFLVRFPFHLAVFGIQRGQRVIDAHPEISTWVVVGHSLGGSMGHVFSQNNARIQGVVYLASYPTGAVDRPSLAMFGTRDGLIDATDALALVEGANIVLIDGGNHAQFGEYGAQSGDAQAHLLPEEQRAIVIQEIQQFLESLTHR